MVSFDSAFNPATVEGTMKKPCPTCGGAKAAAAVSGATSAGKAAGAAAAVAKKIPGARTKPTKKMPTVGWAKPSKKTRKA